MICQQCPAAMIKGPSSVLMHISLSNLSWAGPGSRLAKIVEWCGGEHFDGAIVFDECHRC